MQRAAKAPAAHKPAQELATAQQASGDPSVCVSRALLSPVGACDLPGGVYAAAARKAWRNWPELATPLAGCAWREMTCCAFEAVAACDRGRPWQQSRPHQPSAVRARQATPPIAAQSGGWGSRLLHAPVCWPGLSAAGHGVTPAFAPGALPSPVPPLWGALVFQSVDRT